MEDPAHAYVVTGQDVRPVPDPTVLTARAMEAAKDELRREMDFIRQILMARLDAFDKATLLLQDWRETLPRRLEDSLKCVTDVVSERFLRVDEHFKTLEQRFATDVERFHSIEVQFAERDERAAQTESSAKEAVATALQAAKEAVGAALQAAKEAVAAQNTASNNAILKSETSTDKRIDETVRLLNSTTGALDARIGAIAESSKNTMTRQEVEQLFRTVMDKLDGPTGLAMRLEGVIARGIGTTIEAGRNTQQNQWVIGAIVGAIALVVAMVSLFVHLKSP